MVGARNMCRNKQMGGLAVLLATEIMMSGTTMVRAVSVQHKVAATKTTSKVGKTKKTKTQVGKKMSVEMHKKEKCDGGAAEDSATTSSANTTASGVYEDNIEAAPAKPDGVTVTYDVDEEWKFVHHSAKLVHFMMGTPILFDDSTLKPESSSFVQAGAGVSISSEAESEPAVEFAKRVEAHYTNDKISVGAQVLRDALVAEFTNDDVQAASDDDSEQELKSEIMKLHAPLMVGAFFHAKFQEVHTVGVEKLVTEIALADKSDVINAGVDAVKTFVHGVKDAMLFFFEFMSLPLFTGDETTNVAETLTLFQPFRLFVDEVKQATLGFSDEVDTLTTDVGLLMQVIFKAAAFVTLATAALVTLLVTLYDNLVKSILIPFFAKLVEISTVVAANRTPMQNVFFNYATGKFATDMSVIFLSHQAFNEKIDTWVTAAVAEGGGVAPTQADFDAEKASVTEAAEAKMKEAADSVTAASSFLEAVAAAPAVAEPRTKTQAARDVVIAV
ncbi:unnamed protein product [Amoebophrya sp. A120]|nr:unnamed protein product [Amoebophrya sp. A120]|eukprot:GSA120T00012439001.1